MIGEIILRFLIGGTIVSLFAVVGGLFKPPTFAGLFGSAPSVALATLSIAFVSHGDAYVATEAQWMMIGAVALVAYSAACAWTVSRPRMPVWVAAGCSWLMWLGVAFTLRAVLRPLP